MKTTKPKFTNQLINENSPYLLSHAHNPVNWYPWNETALSKAKKEDKPIFLSIGYAACHWCHVMEKESFENETIASILNDHFISIKVDREQRPDLDQIYMSFTTALTGHGGWPMSVFLTPDLKPFFAGTYFPPENRYGQIGFRHLLTKIAESYRLEKDEVIKSSEIIFDQVVDRFNGGQSKSDLNKEVLDSSGKLLLDTVDKVHGGIGSAPKFPHAVELGYLLRRFLDTKDKAYIHAVEVSLNAMADGGIYDHLGGGFARYSTDSRWLVPHFEKMLYDNALLVETYAEAYLITRKERYKRVVTETLDFILSEMTDPSGAFYSALDADSEGVEGKFYIWTKNEVDNSLNDNSKIFCKYYNVTSKGNFEGANILHLNNDSHNYRSEQGNFDEIINQCKQILLKNRSQRVRPLTDDKVLASWNSLAISAFCRGYQITKDARYLNAAVNCAAFIKNELYKNNKLTHSYRMGLRSQGQFLEDYAYLIKALMDLFESDNSTNNLDWLNFALELADNALELFLDNDHRFYLREDKQTDLIFRPKDERDGATPSCGSVMIQNLFKLHRLTDCEKYYHHGKQALEQLSGQIKRYPAAMVSALKALDFYLNDKIEIVIIGLPKHRQPMLDLLYEQYEPNRIIAFAENNQSLLPIFSSRNSEVDHATAYVCRNSVCQNPVYDITALEKMLKLNGNLASRN